MAKPANPPVIRFTTWDFIFSIAGFIAWGASLIGIVTNIWLGSAVLLVAFGFLTYEFWKWSRTKGWPPALRVAVAFIADAIVLFTGSRQVAYQYHQNLVSSGASPNSIDITATLTTAQTYLVALLSRVPWPWVLGGLALGAFAVFVLMKRRQRSCSEPRLHDLAKQDAIKIKDLVRVTGIHYRPEFGKGSPYIDFVLGFFNISLFDVGIDNSIKKGSILFGEDNEKFYYPPKLEGENIGCRSRSGNYFVVRQAVTAEEITRFRRAKNLLLAFHGLEIMFQGTEQFSQIGPTLLNTHHYLETEKRMWRASDEGETAFTFTDEQWALLSSSNKQEVATLEAQIDLLKAQIEAPAAPKLTFEIDAKTTQVHMSGGTEVRRIEANVKLRCLKTNADKMAVREFDASLHKESQEGEQTVVERVPAARVMLLRTGLAPETNVDISDGLIISEPISPYYWFFFYLEFPPRLDSDLSRDYFVRITMNALGQEPLSIDFYVNSWNDARQSNSYVTLR